MFLWTPGDISGSLQWFRAQSRLHPGHFNKISHPYLDLVGESQESFPNQAKFRWTESAPHRRWLCESFNTQRRWLPKKIRLQSPRLGCWERHSGWAHHCIVSQVSVNLPVVPSVHDEWDQVWAASARVAAITADSHESFSWLEGKFF